MSKTHRSPAVREATGAFCRSLLDAILPPIREVAHNHGYAVAVHGSLSRDIDLVAIPWTEVADTPDVLVQAIAGALSGILGRCHRMQGETAKPHGRIAYTLVHGGFIGEIDLSVFPPQHTEPSGHNVP